MNSSPGSPALYYFGFSHNRPTGGNKHTYRHVDILNAAGLRAFAFHADPAFERYTWFENDTAVIGPAAFDARFDPERDLLVFPEDLGTRMLAFPGRKLIFNKNIYLGARSFGRQMSGADPYLDPTVRAAFAVSAHNVDYLRFAYPHLPVHEVRVEIDASMFSYRPLREKRRIIATNAKAPLQVLTLMHLLRARAAGGHNTLGDVEWVFVEGMSEQQVADVLRDAMVFLFLSTEEGFGRMPAEALACGSVVLAHDVGSLREFLPAACRFQVGDFLGMARRIEEVFAASSTELDRWEADVNAGRDQVLRYSRDAQRTSVLAAWDQVLRDVHQRRAA